MKKKNRYVNLVDLGEKMQTFYKSYRFIILQIIHKKLKSHTFFSYKERKIALL